MHAPHASQFGQPSIRCVLTGGTFSYYKADPSKGVGATYAEGSVPLGLSAVAHDKANKALSLSIPGLAQPLQLSSDDAALIDRW